LQGNQGAQGSVGGSGSNGLQGNQGPQGDIGSNGTQGPQGNVGVQGTIGTNGTQGSQGVQGTGSVNGSLNFIVSNGTSVVTTGVKQWFQVPYNATITDWTITCSPVGSCVLDVKKSNYSSYPTFASITASVQPSIVSAQKATGNTLTGWTTSVSSGDMFEMEVVSVSDCTSILLSLSVTKT
jgi:hypothetical protein